MTKKLKDIVDTKNIKALECRNSYVPEEPIHFRYVKPPPSEEEIPYTPEEPIHFRYVKEETSADHHGEWLNHNENSHLGKTNHEISHRLINDSEHSTPEVRAIKSYSDSSMGLNRKLIAAHKSNTKPALGSDQAETVHYLDKATRRPIGKHLHLYSGVGFHPYEHLKDNGHLHLPAYTSMTHDKTVADDFAQNRLGSGVKDYHVLHIHLKPNDKATHVSHHSYLPAEHESILPRDTTLKVRGKPQVIDTNNALHGNVKLHVWHATVHHQEP